MLAQYVVCRIVTEAVIWPAGPHVSSVPALFDATNFVFVKVVIEDCSNVFVNDASNEARLPFLFYGIQSSAVSTTEDANKDGFRLRRPGCRLPGCVCSTALLQA